MKSKSKSACLMIFLTIFSFFYVAHVLYLWQNASTYSRDTSTAMGSFVEASEWISKRLNQDEIAVVPSIGVFYVLNPELYDRLVDYKSLWDSAGVDFRERVDRDKLLQLREYFISFIKENSSVRYIVRDWGYPYAKDLFEAPINDELMVLLKEVKVIPFTLSTGWSSKITIYGRVQYNTLFQIRLSSAPRQYHTLPANASIQFDSNGATIQKVGSRVGFYLPLEKGINASKQNYLTMQIKLDVEGVELLLVFYYDKNRDGKWSGYEIDYVKSVALNQTKLGWVKGGWYTIYQLIPMGDDPIVQIGIIMRGDHDGAITLSELVVYTEVTPG